MEKLKTLKEPSTSVCIKVSVNMSRTMQSCLVLISLRSKRFRLVSEQRKTDGGTGFSAFFARSLTLVLRSLVRNRTETLARPAKF